MIAPYFRNRCGTLQPVDYLRCTRILCKNVRLSHRPSLDHALACATKRERERERQTLSSLCNTLGLPRHLDRFGKYWQCLDNTIRRHSANKPPGSRVLHYHGANRIKSVPHPVASRFALTYARRRATGPICVKESRPDSKRVSSNRYFRISRARRCDFFRKSRVSVTRDVAATVELVELWHRGKLGGSMCRDRCTSRSRFNERIAIRIVMQTRTLRGMLYEADRIESFDRTDRRSLADIDAGCTDFNLYVKPWKRALFRPTTIVRINHQCKCNSYSFFFLPSTIARYWIPWAISKGK